MRRNNVWLVVVTGIVATVALLAVLESVSAHSTKYPHIEHAKTKDGKNKRTSRSEPTTRLGCT